MHKAVKKVDGGNLSDLYPRWLGTKELLLRGRDPYSAEITADIQKGFYGRLLNPADPDDITDEERLAYPLFIIFLLAPHRCRTVPMGSTAVPYSRRWSVHRFSLVLVAGLCRASIRNGLSCGKYLVAE